MSTNTLYYIKTAYSKKSLLFLVITYLYLIYLLYYIYLDYKYWSKVAELIIKNIYLSIEGLISINTFKNYMKINKLCFNWDKKNYIVYLLKGNAVEECKFLNYDYAICMEFLGFRYNQPKNTDI